MDAWSCLDRYRLDSEEIIQRALKETTTTKDNGISGMQLG